MRSSSSVTATSTPSAANRCMLASIEDGTWPTMKWLSKPTPPIGTPWDFSEETRLYMALLLAFSPSML